MTTAAWSAFAYIWLYLVLVIISPNEVTLWEAIVTLLCFPFLVVTSYMAEKNFFFKVEKPADEPEMKQLVDLSMNLSHIVCNHSEVSNYTREFVIRTSILNKSTWRFYD